MTDQIRPATADDYPAYTVLVIEHDDTLSGALIAAGAEVDLRLLHYTGPLPPAAVEQN
jgi:hypothetical protein